jgi:hypothetical protein
MRARFQACRGATICCLACQHPRGEGSGKDGTPSDEDPAAKSAGAAHSTASKAHQRRGEAKRAERAPGA